METQDENNQTLENHDNSEEKKSRNNLAKRPKPLIEGINAPHSNSVKAPLVNSETTNVKNSGIFLPSAHKKSHPVRNFFLWLFFLSALGYGGFRAYQIYKPKQENLVTDNSSVYTQTVQDNSPETSSGTEVANSTDSSSTSPAVLGSTTTTPVNTPGATSTPLGAHTLKINSNSLGYLNVRNIPASSGKVVTQVHPGEVYSYTNSKYGWYEITLPNGQLGWVSGQYVTLQ